MNKRKVPSLVTGVCFIVMDEIMYYLFLPDDEPLIWLYVLPLMRKGVLMRYHDENGHMDVEKTFRLIKQKYSWPGLLKEINVFVGKFIPCQTQNLRKQQPLMQ